MAAASMRLHLPSNGPLDLALSNQPVTEHLGDRGPIAEGGLYRASRIAGTAAIINARSIAADVVEFRVTSAEQKALPPKDIVAAFLTRKFSLQLDLPAFYRFVTRQPALAGLPEFQRGLRPILKDTLLEALCLAITDQQVNTTFADELKRRLLATFGHVYRVQDRDLWLFPSVEELARLEIYALRPLQYSNNKSRYIVELARQFAAEPKWERLSGGDEEIVGQLCQLRGVGPWTAEYGAMLGLGLVDTLPAADIGLMRVVQQVYSLAERPTEKQVREIGEHWSPWRGLVTFYLWHQEDSAAAAAAHNK